MSDKSGRFSTLAAALFAFFFGGHMFIQDISFDDSYPVQFIFDGALLWVGSYLLSSFRGKRLSPLLWLSRVCVGSLGLTILLLLRHCFRSDNVHVFLSMMGLDPSFPSGFQLAYRSPLFSMLEAAFYTLCGAGTLACLIWKRTRKTGIIALLSALLLGELIQTILRGIQPAGSPLQFFSRRTTALLLFAVMIVFGAYASLLELRRGKVIQSDFEARLQERAKKRVMGKYASPSKPAGTASGGSRSTSSPVSATARLGNSVSGPTALPHTAPASVSSSQRYSSHARGTSLQEMALQMELEKYYEKRMGKPGEPLSLRPAKDLLPAVAQRLYPGGQVLSTLAGQRQLYAMLIRLPCLRELDNTMPGKRWNSASLPDNPERFVPPLQAVVSKAAEILNQKLWDDPPSWRNLDLETLTGCWFALRMYARMSDAPDIFNLAAEAIESLLDTRPDSLRELQSLLDEEVFQHG